MKQLFRKREFSIFLGHIILILITCLFSLKEPDIRWGMYILALSMISILVNALTIKVRKIRITDFRFLFLALIYIFFLGRPWLYAMGLDKQYELFFYRYTIVQLYKSAIYSLLIIETISLGFFYPSSRSTKAINNSRDKQIIPDKKIFYVGLAQLILYFPCTIYRDYRLIQMRLNTIGYASENLLQINGIITILAHLTTTGIAFLFCSRVLTKNKAVSIFVVYSAYELLVSSLSGTRSYAVISIISLVVCLLKVYKIKIRIKTLLLLLLAAWIGGSLLVAIRNWRTVTGFTLMNIVSSTLTVAFSGELINQVLLEFGNTFNAVAKAIQYFPDTVSYYFGKTYLFLGLTLVPFLNRLVPNVTLLYNPIDIMQSLERGFYFGGSIALDTYINFGSAGFLFGYVYGYIINRILSRNYESKGALGEALYFSEYYILFRMIRCGVSEVLRLMVYFLIIQYLFRHLRFRKR